MAISSQVTQLTFEGNGSDSTPYALANLRFDADSWLLVEEIDEDGIGSVLSLGTDYTVTGSGASSSASIVTGGGAIPVTSTLRVSRKTPLVHNLHLIATGQIPSVPLEQVLDWIIMAMQDRVRELHDDQVEGLLRTIRAPQNEVFPELPGAAERVDAVPFFAPVSGDLEILRLDQLAQRLLVILGAEAVLPYRTREVSESLTVTQEDVNTSIRANSASTVVITLPETTDFSDEFFCTFSRFGVGAVEFTAPGGVVIESAVGSAPRIFGAKKPVAVQRIGVNRWWVYGDIY